MSELNDNFLSTLGKMFDNDDVLDSIMLTQSERDRLFNINIDVQIYSKKHHRMAPFTHPGSPGISVSDIIDGLELRLSKKMISSDYCIVISNKQEAESAAPCFLYYCEIYKDDVPSKRVPIICKDGIQISIDNSGCFSMPFTTADGSRIIIFIFKEGTIDVDELNSQYVAEHH